MKQEDLIFFLPEEKPKQMVMLSVRIDGNTRTRISANIEYNNKEI